jgi:hypothetical protein
MLQLVAFLISMVFVAIAIWAAIAFSVTAAQRLDDPGKNLPDLIDAYKLHKWPSKAAPQAH